MGNQAAMETILNIVNVLANILVLFVLYPIVQILKERLETQKAHISLKDDMLKFEQNKTQFMDLVHSSNIQSYTDFNNIKVNSDIINQLKMIFGNLNASTDRKDIINNDANIHLSMAKTYSIAKEWSAAISQFELALPNLPIDWNNYMLYGIACANSRNNSHYLKAIEAYSNAIVYIPDNAEVNMKARLYVYRGSIYKRIGRLDEAVSDLKFALSNISTDGYEKTDALYNIACVYAMQNNISEFNNVMAQLESAEDDDTIDRIKKRLKVYAPNFLI